MRLLVTGACGFIGSNFARFWRAEHPSDQLVGVDLLTYAGVRENLGDDVPFVHGDIGDSGLIGETLRANAIDVVVNFAAESHNSYAVVDPERFLRTNVIGTHRLAREALAAGVARFHHVSTCEVYGDLALDSGESFTEESAYRPRTPYNASKAAADHVVRAAFETYGLPVTITNCCNNYGPRQFPEKLISLFTTLAIDDRPLPVYSSSHHKREWLHVLDHCRAIESVLLRGRVGETYNVGSGEERSVDDVADAILEALAKPRSLKTAVADRPGHDRRYLLDSAKIRRELGWHATKSFDDGLRETVEWYAANRSWWEPLRGRGPVDESGWGR